MRPSKSLRWIALTVPAAFTLLAGPAARAAEGPASAVTAGAAPSATAVPLSPELIDPASLILFSVQLDQLTLTDGLAAYGSEADPLLPVGELTRLLEMDVDVLPAEARVIGRIGESRRSMIIDLATGSAREGARNIPLAPGDVAVTPTEFYVKASLLEHYRCPVHR